MRVLVACEFSGIVRDAFAAKGHDAWSCDLLPSERPGKHIQGSVFDHLCSPWNMLIFFWECTYLCNSGVRWLMGNQDRWRRMEDAAACFNRLLDADIPKVAGENPIQHCHARKLIRKYDQIIHPWQHGHGEIKSTCLWLKGLPPLRPSNIVDGRVARVHREPPSKERWKNRSRTYPGIAAAMAEQWGGQP